jgi:hypothetical protein
VNYLDFLSVALVDGFALGVGLGATPTDVEAAWGKGFIDDLHKRGRIMRRDYGLAEFTFRKDGDWICSGIGVQVHRLAENGNSIVPAAVLDIYHQFPATVSFRELDLVVQGRGVHLEVQDSPGTGFVKYAVPDKGNYLFAVQDDETLLFPSEMRSGDVWAIYIEKAGPVR